MQNNNSYLGTESIPKLLLRLSIPTVISQIVNMLYNVVDRVYIGHMPETGSLALTGLGVCAPLIFIIAALAALFYAGSSARASMSMGRGDYGEAEKILGNSFICLIVMSIIVTAATLVFAEPLLYSFGASGETIEYALGYIRIYALGTIFVSLTLGMNSFITAQGFSRISMLTVTIGAACNIALDPLFIYVFKLGVKGAALATIISQAVSTTWVMLFFRGKRTILRLRAKNLRVDFKLMLPCAALGLSPCIMQATEGFVSICFNSSLLKYGGDIAVGAMTVLSTTMQCVFLVLSGFTQGAQPIISYNFGARNAARVKKTFKLVFTVCFSFTLVFGAIFLFFPRAVASLMTSSAELRDYAAWALRIYLSVFCIFGIQFSCQQTFIGIGNAKCSIFIAILRKLVLLIPFIYIFPHIFEDKVLAVFLAEPAADIISVITTAVLFFFQFRKAMRSISD